MKVCTMSNVNFETHSWNFLIGSARLKRHEHEFRRQTEMNLPNRFVLALGNKAVMPERQHVPQEPLEPAARVDAARSGETMHLVDDVPGAVGCVNAGEQQVGFLLEGHFMT